MKSYTTDQSLKDNEYYHGTWNLPALYILFEGFRLKSKWNKWGKHGTFGSGVYLTKSLDIADGFGTHVFKCTLAKNTRLLNLDGVYDPNVIHYLKKEFGSAILKGDLAKVIPHNKNLTKKELICLLNYRFKHINDFWKGNRPSRWDSLTSSLRQQLLKHKFDAIGEDKDLHGVAVLNPSLVQVGQLHSTTFDPRAKKFVLCELDRDKFIRTISLDIAEGREYLGNNTSSPDDVQLNDYDFLEKLLNRYCSEYNKGS